MALANNVRQFFSREQRFAVDQFLMQGGSVVLTTSPFDVQVSGSLNPDNPITASLGQLILNWALPIQVDVDKNQARKVIELLHSSENSWT
ncbi:hypothetical protein [Methylomarinum vadi]|uniref:hypothetical protein n=1 Tax=Methylomarinum vadi TaxID=438855 RepID=UPI0004DF955D|nr:hypothetical protein [Methylomarinum vadi]